MFEYPKHQLRAHPTKVLRGLLKPVAIQAHGHMLGELEVSSAKVQAGVGVPHNGM